MKKDEILAEMKLIAEENGVDLTENAEKIASFRAKANIPLDICACDKQNPFRGCISNLCMKEIKEEGQCHCHLFQKRV